MSTNVLTTAPGTVTRRDRPVTGILELFDSGAGLLVAVGAVAAYGPPLMRSLWNDEAGTWWMAYRGPVAAIQRTLHWPGQSILFAVITSFFCFEGSPFRDLLLRVPALLGAAACCYFLYRFAEDAFGAGAGRIAAVLMAISPSTVELATQARPYTLAMAAVAASCWTLYRWTESRGRGWLVSYVISSALVVYLHYLFSAIFAVHAVFLLYELVLKRRFFRSWELLAGYAAAALLVAPLAPHILLLLHESGTLPFKPKPSGLDLGEILIPPLFAAGAFASALLIHLAWPHRSGEAPRPSPAVAAMLLALWGLGPLLLFAVSSATTMRVLVERYVAYSGLGFVLLLAYAGYSIFGSRAGFTWVLTLVALTTAGNVVALVGVHEPSVTELGPSMQAVREESAKTGSDLPPVLFQSALIESNFHDWRAENSPQSYFIAPFVAYPLKNKLLPLPYELTQEVKDHVDHLLKTDLMSRNKVIFVAHDFLWVSWFTERFEREGFTFRFVRPNAYWVVVFERRAGAEGH